MVPMKKVFAKLREHGPFGLPLYFVRTRIQLPLKRYLELVFRERLLNSYSQYAEDLIIDHLLADQLSGTYIDVGANDPDHFNNTKRFYLKGWRGINVEPNPILFQKLIQVRGGGDINLNIGIGRSKGVMDFHVVRPHVLSTFSSAEAESLRGHGYRVEKTIPVEIWPLSEVLQQHQHHFGRPVDLLSIDVEGLELEVLDSHDWRTIRPRLVLIEINRNPQMIHDRMVAFGYRLLFENGTNGLYAPNGS